GTSVVPCLTIGALCWFRVFVCSRLCYFIGCWVLVICSLCFLFRDTATTETSTLSLHDALPISSGRSGRSAAPAPSCGRDPPRTRSEEHTSELQSRVDLVCRLLLEKKKKPFCMTLSRGTDFQPAWLLDGA